jgi:tetratricopeptide (TPR) repeat protein
MVLAVDFASMLDDTAWAIVMGTLMTMGLLALVFVVPKWRANSLRSQPHASPTQQELVAADQAPPAPLPPLPLDTETSMLAARAKHDKLLEESGRLYRQARGHHFESVALLEEAIAKAGEAREVRGDSYDAIKMMGDAHLALAAERSDEEALADLATAADAYETALSYRRGVIDVYLGLGWSLLETGYRANDQAGAQVFSAAAATFARGHEVSPPNLFVLRGWGSAVDGLLRTNAPDADNDEASYLAAIGNHPLAGDDLRDWYLRIRTADEMQRVPVPQVRDV